MVVCSSPPVVSENLLAGVDALERHHRRLALRRELAKRGVVQGRVAAVVDVPARPAPSRERTDGRDFFFF